jgi:hypothetical protein
MTTNASDNTTPGLAFEIRTSDISGRGAFPGPSKITP